MTTATAYRPPIPTAAQLGRQIGTVLADLPLFLTAPAYRRWHCRWGATAAEVAAAMPGDDRLEQAQYRCTRAVTINAPADQVWPWLVQVGCLRAGFYSNDLLDNLAHPSATRIIPQLQQLHTGQWVPMSPTPSVATAFTVDSYEQPRWLLWSKPDSTWSWTLTPTGSGATRLVTRVHARYEWSRPTSALLSVLLMEFGDFAMMRRMLLGIKQRAEAAMAHQAKPRRPHSTSTAERAPHDQW